MVCWVWRNGEVGVEIGWGGEDGTVTRSNIGYDMIFLILCGEGWGDEGCIFGC